MSKNPSQSSRQHNHQSRWLHNRELLGKLHPDYADWMVTVAFYAAVHVVEMVFAHDGCRQHTTHDSRRGTLNNLRRYTQLRKSYFHLYNLSRTARYNPDPSEWFSAQRVREELVKRALYPLERSALKLLKKDPIPEIQWEHTF